MCELLFTDTRCKNCRVPVESGFDMCTLCLSRRKCVQCTRHLSECLYDGDDTTCKTCQRKLSNKTVDRTAFRGLAREITLSTNSSDCDLDTFLTNNIDALASSLQQSLDEHT